MYVAYVPLFPPPFSVVVAVLFVTSMPGWSRPSSSSVSGDGFWKRALSALPVALADGLRTAELDDPTVLASYPRMDLEEAVLGLRSLSCTTVRFSMCSWFLYLSWREFPTLYFLESSYPWCSCFQRYVLRFDNALA